MTLASAATNVLNELAGLAEEHRRKDLVERLRAESAPTDSPVTTLVVGGEVRKGKSSLINALLQRPDLSPVEVDATTTVHLVIRHAETERATVVRQPVGAAEPERLEIPVAEIKRWVSNYENPGNREGVRLVDVELDHPLLARGLAIVDTPGVGGLIPAHAAVTSAALAGADALLFVVDAEARMQENELDFLENATSRIGTIFFAITKWDRYPASRDEVLEQDREALQATRYAGAQIFPVSSKRRLEGKANSGFEELEKALLAGTEGKTDLLRTANMVRLGRSTVETLDELEQAIISGAGGDPAILEKHAEAQTRLDDYRKDAGRQGHRAVIDLMTALRRDLITDFNRKVNDLRQQYGAKIVGNEVRLEAFPEELAAAVQAVALDLNTQMARAVVNAMPGLQNTLGVEGIHVDPVPFELSASELRSAGEFAPGTVAEPGQGSLLDTAGKISLGRSLGMMVDMVLPGAGMIIGPLAGLGFAAISSGKQKETHTRQQATAVLSAVTQAALTEIPPRLTERLDQVQRLIEDRLDDAIEHRIDELTEAKRKYEQIAQEDAADKQAARQAAQLRRRTLNGLSRTLSGLEQQLAAASVVPTVEAAT